MDFSAFLSHLIGSRVADPELGNRGIPQDSWYEDVSLVKQYIRDCIGFEPNQGEVAEIFWTGTTDLLLESFTKLATTDVGQGDIVITLSVVGYHVVIATGRQNTIQFEAVEQNGGDTKGTGLDDNAIRYHWIYKKNIVGVLRPKTVEDIKSDYKPPSGALKVPTKTKKYYVHKTVLGFSAWSKAAHHQDARKDVARGEYYIFRETNGMINVTKTPGIAGYWINPSDNTPDIQR